MSTSFRRLRLGLQTLLWSKPAGYFIPYRYAADIPDFPPDARVYPGVEKAFVEAETSFDAHLQMMEGLAEDLVAIGRQDQPPEPRWEQDWFPALDAAAGYAMVRRYAPKRIIEIGSGHSTRFYARAVRDAVKKGAFETQITAIDPAPRADLSSLAGITLRREIVQQTEISVFKALESGDFLCIDSSHILMPASDVDILINAVLPSLPSGVIVHIHDMLLPWDYPPAWKWRAYNEQSGVAPLLINGFEPLWSSIWANRRMNIKRDAPTVASLHRNKGAIETSLWLRKR